MFWATFSDEASQRVYSSQPLIAGGDAALSLFLYIGRWSPIAQHGGWMPLYLYKYRYAVEGYASITRREAIAHAFS